MDCFATRSSQCDAVLLQIEDEPVGQRTRAARRELVVSRLLGARQILVAVIGNAVENFRHAGSANALLARCRDLNAMIEKDLDHGLSGGYRQREPAALKDDRECLTRRTAVRACEELPVELLLRNPGGLRGLQN